MESEAFNEKFEVYAEDEHEAFYLLTPSFMEKLEQAEHELDGRMYYGFFGHEFHVAVDNRQNSLSRRCLRRSSRRSWRRSGRKHIWCAS